MSNSANAAEGERVDEIGREQEYVSMLYGRLDGLRKRASHRLATTLRETGGTPQARSERDLATRMYTEKLAQYSAVESGLCFGRLDFDSGDHRYIGRIGIFDENGEYEPLLVDWRAPAARAFYLATAASPEGVRRRRHLKTRMRKVVEINDDVLDLDEASNTRHEGLTAEAALLSAMNASRTGRMKDIVETIQAEQDRIIRSDSSGVLVVQGGPGTGKTAVALHRAAYLLYTRREQLSKRGVLIVGPNATLLQYISQVLPTLGETGVLLSTVDGLFPGASAEIAEPVAAAEIKGRLDMVEVVEAAIRDCQRVPEDVLEVLFERETLVLDRETCAAARDRARRSRRKHNLARPILVAEIIQALAGQVADQLGADLLDAGDLADIRRELEEDAEVQAALDWLWPVLTPQRLLEDLFASADLIESAAPWLTAQQRALLVREPVTVTDEDDERPAVWSPADVPLLDEAAEQLGEDDAAAKAQAERERREQIQYAQGVLDILGLEEDEADPDILLATDLISADRLAERHEDESSLTAAERAAADRTWTFGHIIVDEAQELSPMAWRLLMRRCPSRSMTLVGDVAQTGDLAGAGSWQEVLGPYVDDRWRLARLTVNYRTPAEIMAVAAPVLAQIDPTAQPPSSVREAGVEPWSLRVTEPELAKRLTELVVREAAEVGEGRLGVLVPAARVAELGDAVTSVVPEAAVGDGPELESHVVVLTVRQAKGLEFDSVLVVEPEQILAESTRGANDLYVALTRSTQRLGVVHHGELPVSLAGLGERAVG